MAGLRPGCRSFIWMLQIVIPVSFIIALLQWTGWLNKLDVVLSPLMSLLRLPPEAALPIVTGMLVNIYAVLGAATVMPFTMPQLTLIAIFSLHISLGINHGMIEDPALFVALGLNVLWLLLPRLLTAIAAVHAFRGMRRLVGRET